MTEHPYDLECPNECPSCDDIAWEVEEQGVNIACPECGHLILWDVGALTHDHLDDHL